MVSTHQGDTGLSPGLYLSPTPPVPWEKSTKVQKEGTIEIVVTPRSSLEKEKSKILFWHNWVANQLKNRLFCNITIKIHTIRMY